MRFRVHARSTTDNTGQSVLVTDLSINNYPQLTSLLKQDNSCYARPLPCLASPETGTPQAWEESDQPYADTVRPPPSLQQQPAHLLP